MRFSAERIARRLPYRGVALPVAAAATRPQRDTARDGRAWRARPGSGPSMDQVDGRRGQGVAASTDFVRSGTSADGVPVGDQFAVPSDSVARGPVSRPDVDHVGPIPRPSTRSGHGGNRRVAGAVRSFDRARLRSPFPVRRDGTVAAWLGRTGTELQ